MAKTFELYTMNGFCVIAKMAGMESTAKIRSVVSTSISTTKRGVATRRDAGPACSRTKNCCPWYTRVIGTRRRMRRIARLDSGSKCPVAVAIRTPVNTRKAPKT